MAASNSAGIDAPDTHLNRVAPSLIVDINRAIAVAFSEGPGADLALIDALYLDARLGDYHLLHATRADLLRGLDEESAHIGKKLD